MTAFTQMVRCTHCGGVYDLCKVEVTARYTDCSMWKSPCCGLLVDDRGDTGWKSRKDYITDTRDQFGSLPFHLFEVLEVSRD